MRRHATSGSPFEEQFGFTRAVKEGNRIVVAGTGPIEEDGSTTEGDAAAQADRCCRLIIKAIEDLGGSAVGVVRTRMFLVSPGDQEAVGEVHKKHFGDARPAATMVGVAWLCREDWLVEIEAEALISDQ
ncbi:RidA family protein [Aurantiacibacter sp. MUD61]|uniref:RidA family protein n=1 Tax=Aurantiacibacter sp. MUD61 TaxID=3009083 RepID=UPI0022F0E9AE|nr:RidA family protein [Aurantiacibacter sp. MUD61]